MASRIRGRCLCLTYVNDMGMPAVAACCAPQFSAVLLSAVAVVVAGVWRMFNKPTVYLVDFVAQRPDDRYVDAVRGLLR